MTILTRTIFVLLTVQNVLSEETQSPPGPPSPPKPPSAPASKCPRPNEEYSSCGPSTPRSCQSVQNISTSLEGGCVEGCFCIAGYKLDASGNCIRAEQCPGFCPENEVFSSCGTACPITCKNFLNPPKFCTFQCVFGCVCKNGYIRDTQTGKCVLPDHCSGPCFDNEIFMGCYNNTKRCEYKCNGARKCRFPTDCYNNCLCKPDFYRDLRSLQCVKRDDCGRKTRY